MSMSLQETINLRDRLYYLNIDQIITDMQIYKTLQYQFIKANEGCTLKPYRDTEGNVTVGIGFNMDANGAQQAWSAVFGNSPSFDSVYDDGVALTDDDVRNLFNFCIQQRLEQLKHIYGQNWFKLRPNERLSIVDSYYNAPSLVNEHTHFYKYINQYVDTNDSEFLQQAINEIQNDSNPSQNNGLQNRRDVEAAMLESPK